MDTEKILSVLPIAPAVNNQIEIKQKTGKEKHTNNCVLACLSSFKMDGQSESIIMMGTKGEKNGMVQEAGELMKLKKQTRTPVCSLLGGSKEKT